MGLDEVTKGLNASWCMHRFLLSIACEGVQMTLWYVAAREGNGAVKRILPVLVARMTLEEQEN